MSSTKPNPLARGACDVTITWNTGWKFTAKGNCPGIFFEIIGDDGIGHTKLDSLHDFKFYPPTKGEDDTSLL